MSHGAVAPELALSTSSSFPSSSKYKAYTQSIEKALKAFENTNEWADLIAALGKLSKVLNSGLKFGDIPKTVIVAKRLSQCLHPALPMGVHLKALESYRQVFDILGPEKLAQLLYLFAVGLFPLMDHCGIKVKGELFTIFEIYLLRLGPLLRPCLPGFLAGVLLGLEEGTEFYDRSLSFLNRLYEAVGGDSFFGCLWEAVLGSPAVRLPAFIYANTKFDKSKPASEQSALFRHPELLVAALCAAADDAGSPLVQRYLLDFVTSAFPFDGEELSEQDFIELLEHFLFIVLRRDMSLNRRLYQWMLSPKESTMSVSGVAVGDDRLDSSFFIKAVHPLIQKALANFLKKDTIEIPSPPANSMPCISNQKDYEKTILSEVRVCRLLLYLQDRPEIGKPVLLSTLPKLLVELVSKDPMTTNRIEDSELPGSVQLTWSPEVELTPAKKFQKRVKVVAKSFRLLMASLDDDFIWDYLANWFKRLILKPFEERSSEENRELMHIPAIIQLCLQMAELDRLPSTRLLHLPTLLKSLLIDLRASSVASLDDTIFLEVVSVFQKLLEEITIAVGPIAATPDSEEAQCSSPVKSIGSTETTQKEQKMVEECLIECVRLFDMTAKRYVANRGSVMLPHLKAACQLVKRFVDFPLYCFDLSQPIETEWCKALLAVIDAGSWALKGADCDFSARSSCLDLLCYVFVRSAQVLEQHKEFDANKDTSSSATTILLKPMLLNDALKNLEAKNVFELSSRALWKVVSNGNACEQHEIAARLLATIHARRPSDPSSEAEAILLENLTQNDQVACTEAARTFERVWALSRDVNEVLPGLPPKLYSRVAMLLLGVLSDESVGSERVELKASAMRWFVGCAKHDDLPRIVQMISTMLINPVTARVSIQYVTLRSSLTSSDIASLPRGISAVTLLTADERQNMHHIVLDCEPSTSCASEICGSSAWMSELRAKLLASNSDASLPSSPRDVTTTARSPQDSEIPNFDDDTDTLSVDNLSLNIDQAVADGFDPAVVECVAYLIDITSDAEEAELEVARRVREIRDNAASTSASVVFRTGGDSSDNSPPKVDRKPPLPPAATGSDSVSRLRRGHRRTDSLQESIFSCGAELKLLEQCEPFARLPPKQTVIDGTSSANASRLFDELHTHMLLYGESGRLVDLSRCESAFRILVGLLRLRGGPVLPSRMLLSCLVASNTSATDSSTLVGHTLLELVNRHVKAILGHQFWGSTNNAGDDDAKSGSNRQLSLLELLLTISLHFLRSYFLNSPIAVVTDDDLVAAWKCKMAALEFLATLLVELDEMLRSQQSLALVIFVQQILQRSKLQKCLLHLLLTAVYDTRAIDVSAPSVSVSIAQFNEGRWASESKRLRISGLLNSYNNLLLSLTAATIRIEHDIKIGVQEFADESPSGLPAIRSPLNHSLVSLSQHRASTRENQTQLVELRMFVVAVLSAIKHKPERHEIWFQFIMHILPWMDRSLSPLGSHIVEQLCKNIETAAIAAYPNIEKSIIKRSPSSDGHEPSAYPANYIIMCLETLTTIVHFCIAAPTGTLRSPTGQDDLVKNASNRISTTSGGSSSSTSTGVVGQAMQAIPGTQLLTSLVKAAFTFSDTSTTGGAALTKTDPRTQSWQEASKKTTLQSLPHSLATICDLWAVLRSGTAPRLPLGREQAIREFIIELLTPLAQNHQTHYLQAMSLVWLTRSNAGLMRKAEPDTASFEYTPAQLDVANLLMAVQVLPLEAILIASGDALRDQAVKPNRQSNSSLDKGGIPFETPLLELVHGCLRGLNAEQIIKCWPALHALFTETPLLLLPPRAVFLLFIMLCDFVRIASPAYIVEDRAIVTGVHASCQKLTDTLNSIVGWQLEATTWLKRTLVVKSDPSVGSSKGSASVDASPIVEYNGIVPSENPSTRGSTMSLLTTRPTSLDTSSISSAPTHSSAQPTPLESKKSAGSLRSSGKDTNNNKRDPAHSTQALFLLAENLPELIDAICKGDDKERLLPLLTAVWANAVPYLRSKIARYSRFFLASSQLLANMSSYSHMRSVWKKVTFELLLDPAFFRMDIQSVKQWLLVTDHLMTHDKTSFKELLKSVSYTPSLSLMQSREAEYEARSQALKRLAFIVFGSEMDQYQNQLHDIQEKLTDNLRVSTHPLIRANVFLCYRVLLIRLRPHCLVSMWPGMFTELIHVLMQVEQQLSDDANDVSSKDDVSAREDQWHQLFLAAAKLLEALCTLPSGYIAEFQMCNWAFVPSAAIRGYSTVFTPFAGRISKRLEAKYGVLSERELSTTSTSLSALKSLASLEELRAFFYALTMHDGSQKNTPVQFASDAAALTGRLSHAAAMARLEQGLLVEFADNWLS